MALFVNAWIQFFFLLTPFFALSMFVLYTAERTAREKKALAGKVTLAVLTLGLVLFFLGDAIFALVGITVDSFRVGAGVLLFLSAVSLVQGSAKAGEVGDDVAVVPLAVPVVLGPATIGAILVRGAETRSPGERAVTVLALAAAVAGIGMVLLSSDFLVRAVKNRGIAILSKLTGLVLAAMAAQMVVQGVRSLLKG